MCVIMLDTKGPEIRTGFLKDAKPIQFKQGQEITIMTDYTIKGDANMISMSYKKLAEDLRLGNTILCVDGTITLTVLSTDKKAATVRCRCENTFVRAQILFMLGKYWEPHRHDHRHSQSVEKERTDVHSAGKGPRV